jgi:hypothetical protein
MAETFELHADGEVEGVNEAFDEVPTGRARARLVFDLR